MTGFRLAARLEADSLFLADWPLSQVRLMDDCRYPWLLLVPRIASLEEWDQLSDADAVALSLETKRAVSALRASVRPVKVNVAALGNIVRQFHLHVVGRFESDPAWPGPVWGAGNPEPYPVAECEETIRRWRTLLSQG